MTVRTIDDIFRDFNIDGVPASGTFNPHKPDIRDTLKALTEGGSSFPDNRVIRLNNANSGSANNIVVSTSVTIPATAYQVLYILNVTQENTGPVDVSGAISRQLVTNRSEPIPAGYLVPGMAVLCIDTGTELRMLSYGDVESVVEEFASRAEAAEAAAELAKDQAQNAASDAVSQGNVPIYSTRNAVETLEIPAGISAIRTNGFGSVGDGGGALYKRVASEPSHPGKVQSGDGAWWELDMRNGVNVLQFGAKGNGSVDDQPAIQAAVNALSTVGGVVRVPRGTYNLADGLIITQNTVNWHDTKRISFIGDGSGLTRFYYTGPAANKAVIKWGTIDTLDGDGTYGNSWAKIGGFLLEGRGAANVGLEVLAKSWFEADDIRIIGALEKNFLFVSTVSWSGRSLRSYGSKVGMDFYLGDGPLSYSIPNNITLIDVTIGNATVWGLKARNSGPINFIGGSFEGNGNISVDESGGIQILTNDSGAGIEAVAANFYGTYFEHNKGGADVYITQQSGALPRVVNFNGVNFNRVHATEFTKNNIRLEVLGGASGRVNITGSGFNYGGAYVPNAARRCLAITGNVANPENSINYDIATAFRSGVDGPNDLNAPWNSADALAFATVRCADTGVVIRKRNVSSVIKTGTGKYRINFQYTARSSSPQVTGSIVGGHGFVSVIGESASNVDIETKDSGGTTVDLPFNLIVFNA